MGLPGRVWSLFRTGFGPHVCVVPFSRSLHTPAMAVGLWRWRVAIMAGAFPSVCAGALVFASGRGLRLVSLHEASARLAGALTRSFHRADEPQVAPGDALGEQLPRPAAVRDAAPCAMLPALRAAAGRGCDACRSGRGSAGRHRVGPRRAAAGATPGRSLSGMAQFRSRKSPAERLGRLDFDFRSSADHSQTDPDILGGSRTQCAFRPSHGPTRADMGSSGVLKIHIIGLTSKSARRALSL